MYPNLFHGETVVLELPDGTTEDVEHVLVHQSDLSDQTVLDVQTRFINQARYKGDMDTLTLEFPKARAGSLMDCHIWVRGERFRVYGDPWSYDDADCPTAYDRQVTVTRPQFKYTLSLLAETYTSDEWGVSHVEYTPREVKANLLRLADDYKDGAGTDNAMQGITLFEIDKNDYDGELAYEWDGIRYRMSARAYAQDTIVLTALGVLGQ